MRDIKKIVFFTLVPVILIAAAYTYSWVSHEKVQDINADYSETVKVPIIMYHGLIKDQNLQTQYFISPDRFEEDLKYIKDNGYTPVFMSDLIDFVCENRPLPEKPIVLSFDDGYYNNYCYAYPLLKKYNMKAVISIIGLYTDKFSKADENTAAYSHITWKQLNEMTDSGLVEIQSHTYNMHEIGERRGSARKQGESKTQYRKILTDDLVRLQREIKHYTGKAPDTFTYPFGIYSDYEEELVKELGFKATLSCSEGVNYITFSDKECLYQLKRYLRDKDSTSSTMFEKFK